MGGLAALLCSAAAYYYPRTSADAVIGETGRNLFDEFENQVWNVQIVKVDGEGNGPKQLSLVRKGQKWVAGNSNLVLTGSLITVAVSVLNEKTILQEESDNNQDHVKFGVVDPVEFKPGMKLDAVGAKITLKDINKNTMADLIVGQKVQGTANQYYVRRPGQPKVYTVVFEKNVLTTDIGDWMNSNILGLRLPNNPNGLTPRAIVLDNYRMETTGSNKGTANYLYEMKWQPDSRVPKFRIPDGEDWVDYNPNDEQLAKIARGFGSIANIRLISVQSKSKKLSELLSADVSKLTAEQFASAAKQGFLLAQEGDQPEFRGANGGLTVSSVQGVETSMLFGSIATSGEASADSVNYYMMLVARVAQDLQKSPAAPEPEKEGEELTDDQKKAFAKATKAWKTNLEAATQTVNDINRQHASWFYVISEESVRMLRPEIKAVLPKPSEPTETPEVEKENQPDSDESKVESNN